MTVSTLHMVPILIIYQILTTTTAVSASKTRTIQCEIETE